MAMLFDLFFKIWFEMSTMYKLNWWIYHNKVAISPAVVSIKLIYPAANLSLL